MSVLLIFLKSWLKISTNFNQTWNVETDFHTKEASIIWEVQTWAEGLELLRSCIQGLCWEHNDSTKSNKFFKRRSIISESEEDKWQLIFFPLLELTDFIDSSLGYTITSIIFLPDFVTLISLSCPMGSWHQAPAKWSITDWWWLLRSWTSLDKWWAIWFCVLTAPRGKRKSAINDGIVRCVWGNERVAIIHLRISFQQWGS